MSRLSNIIINVVLIAIPVVMVFLIYLKIFLYVKKAKQNVHQQSNSSKVSSDSIKLAKTLFVSFAIFVTNW